MYFEIKQGKWSIQAINYPDAHAIENFMAKFNYGKTVLEVNLTPTRDESAPPIIYRLDNTGMFKKESKTLYRLFVDKCGRTAKSTLQRLRSSLS